VVEEGADQREDFTLEEGRLLRGRVVGPQGQGLADAWIFAAGAGTQEIDPLSGITSDANGRFAITTREGAVDLHVLADGWAPGTAAGVTAFDDADQDAVVIRLQRGGELRVRVLGPDENPIAGSRITLIPRDPSPGGILALFFRPTPPADALGEIRIDALAPGSYDVASADRAEMTPLQVTIVSGETTSVKLVVPAAR
jgi:hypothetical protein